jgi:1,3-beta-galactosyl-N-acetylhexosamine phosphorylase
MVHHALYQKQNYSYAGVIEILSGAPFDVSFISFDDIIENSNLLSGFDVIINVGGAGTAHSGGDYWKNEFVISQIRKFIATGGGFIGIGEPVFASGKDIISNWQTHLVSNRKTGSPSAMINTTGR